MTRNICLRENERNCGKDSLIFENEQICSHPLGSSYIIMKSSSILQKRMKNLEKRKEMLKEIGSNQTPSSCIDIDSTITQIKPEKKDRKKRAPKVVDESMRRKSRYNLWVFFIIDD